MSDDKPGCIHPGDPEGCMNNTICVALLVVAVAALLWRRKVDG
jgi:uncharacterized protein (TIGR03382 family)